MAGLQPLADLVRERGVHGGGAAHRCDRLEQDHALAHHLVDPLVEATGEPWCTTIRHRSPSKTKTLSAATVPPMRSPMRFSSTLIHATSPSTLTDSFVRMNCSGLSARNRANHEPDTAPHPRRA